jgi:DNA helicase-2/ATP-dependent DNA helicase PcrA
MDFDDLLVLTYRMLKQEESLRKKYAERFQYVFVDEYQDTNFAQQQIVTLLTKEHRRICVVGDDYQSIYAFRGAKIDNILNFNKIYPEAKLFKLEQNYRSTQFIVAAANSLMKHNSRQIPKDVYSKNEEGEKLTVFETISDKREAAMVCQEIKRIKQEENCRWSDFAILYRTNAQSRTFEEEMRKPEVGLGKHYRIYGGLSFYQRKEIKDIIAYFRMVVNPADEEAFRRIINYPTRGIGATTLQKIIDAGQHHHVSFWDVVCHPYDYQLDVNKGTLGKLSAFQSLIEGFMQKSKSTDAFVLGNEIIDQSGIKTDLAADKTAEGDARRQNVDALVSGIAEFVQGQREDDQAEYVGLSDYLSTVSLMTDMDSDDGSDDKLTMMTIHAAKGLEFPTVFVVGMEENIFPSTMSVGTPKELEEERRLLYVAITRAEKHCYLTWSHSRWLYGKMDSFVNPSRFLNDIDQKYITVRTESGRSSGRWFDNDDEPVRRPWDDDYEVNRPYMGSGTWNSGYRRMSDRMQNSRPVAGQFMADAKPKETAPRRPESAVNPFSPEFEQKLKQRGRWKRVSQAMSSGGRTVASTSPVSTNAVSSTPSSPQGAPSGLQTGQIIEHHRFGRGTVVKVEGVGENAKATVDFDTTGRKQLLLKFARFNVVG